MLFVGFPQSSLDKFCIEGTHVEPLVDGRVNLILPGELVKPDNSEESLETEFQNWRITIPLAQPKEELQPQMGKDTPEKFHSSSVSMTGIMKQILEYPVEKHSPIECMLFVVDLKQMITTL